MFRDRPGSARRRNGGRSRADSQESLLRRSTETLDNKEEHDYENGSMADEMGKRSVYKNDYKVQTGGKGDAHGHMLQTTEDLLAHEPNFDASGVHLGFYYPESGDEDVGAKEDRVRVVGKKEVFKNKQKIRKISKKP